MAAWVGSHVVLADGRSGCTGQVASLAGRLALGPLFGLFAIGDIANFDQ